MKSEFGICIIIHKLHVILFLVMSSFSRLEIVAAPTLIHFDNFGGDANQKKTHHGQYRRYVTN